MCHTEHQMPGSGSSVLCLPPPPRVGVTLVYGTVGLQSLSQFHSSTRQLLNYSLILFSSMLLLSLVRIGFVSVGPGWLSTVYVMVCFFISTCIVDPSAHSFSFVNQKFFRFCVISCMYSRCAFQIHGIAYDIVHWFWLTSLEKVSFHSNPKGNAKECSDYHSIALISQASKVILKIPQARFQQ